MAGEYEENRGQVYSGNLKVKDIEEKQNIMRDRLLLIGQNLIETKEENSEKILEIKKKLNQ